MEDEKGMEIESETLETPVPQEPNLEPPTAEAQLATLRLEMADVKQKYEQTDKGLRSAHATLTQKDKLLKEKEDLRGDIELLKGMIKVLATSRNIKNEAYDLEGIAKNPEPTVDDEFKKLEEEHSAKLKETESKAFAQLVREYQSRTDSLRLDPNSEDYLDIRTFVVTGNFDRAEAKLKKLEAHTVETKKTETPEEMEARLRKEIEKKILDERGLLESETGLPSGTNIRSFTQQQIADMPMEEYIKLRPEIEKAMAAGKVK